MEVSSTLMAAGIQGAANFISSVLGLSVLPKNTTTCWDRAEFEPPTVNGQPALLPGLQPLLHSPYCSNCPTPTASLARPSKNRQCSVLLTWTFKVTHFLWCDQIEIPISSSPFDLNTALTWCGFNWIAVWQITCSPCDSAYWEANRDTLPLSCTAVTRLSQGGKWFKWIRRNYRTHEGRGGSLETLFQIWHWPAAEPLTVFVEV